MEKTIILSYARTGSTAVFDVYRKYIEANFKDSIRVPMEVACKESWLSEIDFDGVVLPMNKFKKKYNLEDLMKYMAGLDETNYHLERQKLGSLIFENILKEPNFVTKIFPEQFIGAFDQVSTSLKDFTESNGKIIALYRRNVLEGIASIILANEEQQWVCSTAWSKLKKRNCFEKSKRSQEAVEIEIEYYLEHIAHWYSFINFLKEKGIPLTVVAYEDIPAFNFKMLNYLEDAGLTTGYETSVGVQQDSRDRTNAIFYQKDLIEKMVKRYKSLLPMNIFYQLEL